VGELWIEGPSVATRHITPVEDDKEKFSVPTFPESESRFLRTGDLAFIHRGMVYNYGRTKELIIVGGRNIVPIDIEDDAGSAHPAIRAGCVAAFGVTQADEVTEGIAVVAEVRAPRRKKNYSKEEIAAVIRKVVGRVTDAECRYVTLVRDRTLQKTTSGKLMRLEIRKAFEQKSLSLLAPTSETEVEMRKEQSVALLSDALTHPGPVTPVKAEEWIIASMCEQLRLEPEAISRDAGFADYGINSMTAVTSKHVRGSHLALPISSTLLLSTY